MVLTGFRRAHWFIKVSEACSKLEFYKNYVPKTVCYKNIGIWAYKFRINKH